MTLKSTEEVFFSDSTMITFLFSDSTIFNILSLLKSHLGTTVYRHGAWRVTRAENIHTRIIKTRKSREVGPELGTH